MTRLPFTPEQFFQVFAMYNGQFRVAVALWWIVSLGVIAAAWWKPPRFSRLLTHLLAALWMWNAVAYHAAVFTRINPAAWLFAALFLIEAVLLLWAVVPRSLEYFSSRRPTSGIGLGLVVYAFLGLAVARQRRAKAGARASHGVPLTERFLEGDL